MTLLGYLVSQSREVVNWLCIITEETQTENNGGTGKSLIMQAPKYWRKRFFKDMAKEIGYSPRFMWSGLECDEQYAQIDELPKSFDFRMLFTFATDDWTFEKKGKDMITLPKELAPKMVFGTNFFPRGQGDSYLRRFKMFELSNHYKRDNSPGMEFGHMLFSDWDADEWARFDSFMARCVYEYINCGLIQCNSFNIEEKRLFANFDETLIEWLTNEVFSDKNLERTLTIPELINRYSSWHERTYNCYGRRISPNKMVEALRAFAEFRGYDVNQKHTNKGNVWTITKRIPKADKL